VHRRTCIDRSLFFRNCSIFFQSSFGATVEQSIDVADSIICERAFEFSVRILDLGARLWNQGPVARRVASELIRCGTSIGANAEEAQEGQTKPDYIAKMSISRKEFRETLYWLRLGVRAKVLNEGQVVWELREAAELRRMIVAAIITAQSNPSRGERADPVNQSRKL
jgi:four helix bundle protein